MNPQWTFIQLKLHLHVSSILKCFLTHYADVMKSNSIFVNWYSICVYDCKKKKRLQALFCHFTERQTLCINWRITFCNVFGAFATIYTSYQTRKCCSANSKLSVLSMCLQIDTELVNLVLQCQTYRLIRPSNTHNPSRTVSLQGGDTFDRGNGKLYIEVDTKHK